jgi:hypothetical protein
MQGQVKANARFQQVLYFFVGFCAAKCFVEMGKYNLGHFKIRRPCQFAADQFGNQGLDALSRPLNFSTYKNPSSASAMAGNEPPSRKGVT